MIRKVMLLFISYSKAIRFIRFVYLMMVRNSLLLMNVSWLAGEFHNVSFIHCPLKLRAAINIRNIRYCF